MSAHVFLRRLGGALCALALAACAPAPILEPASPRAFDFARDTLAFDNELVWPRTANSSAAPPDYTHRCFPMTRAARLFYQFARFDPAAAPLDEAALRARVREVLAHTPRERTRGEIVIPGYAGLRALSAAHRDLLMDEMGGALNSYFQRGNWRMVLPFTRGQQEKTAQTLLEEVRAQRPPVVHLATFPHTRINHAVLLYDAVERPDGIEFLAYDPNDHAQPMHLAFDHQRRRFTLPPDRSFSGGEVEVYEVYRSLAY